MIKFFRGPKGSYDVKAHGQGIYFATDTMEIIANGASFTGVDDSHENVQEWNDVVGSVSEAFENGGMVTLAEDQSISETLTVKSGASAVLDLGNHNISNTATEGKPFAISVEKGAELTICGNGKIDGGQGGNNQALNIKGSAVIESGHFYVGSDAAGAGNACVEVNGGTLKIYGGVFECATPYAGKYFVINKKDRSGAKILIYGGTFVNFDPAHPGTENPDETFVANGYKSVQIEGTSNYQVVKI